MASNHRRCLTILLSGLNLMAGVAWVAPASAQVADAADTTVASIPVNNTESKVGTFTLPDPLKMFDGTPVTDAKMWNDKRRPELLKFFEGEYYGKIPATAPKVTWQVVRTDEHALDGKAVQKVLAGHMGSADGPAIDVTLYTPSNSTKPVPILAAISFNFGAARGARGPASGPAVGAGAPGAVAARGPATGPGLAGGRAGRGGRGGGTPPRNLTPLDLINRGYAYATISYTSIETDTSGRGDTKNVNIVRKLALASGQTQPNPDEWGTVSAWAWGISRFVDYLETDPAIDAKRVAITGTSRLGKTVTWAGASDQRIALVIACCGGEGGAALARRNYGETIAHLVEETRYPYQFALNYGKYAKDPNTSPVDTHCLVALMAPRPILLSTASADNWSDPYGEYLAGVAATPVYKLLGKQGYEPYKFRTVDPNKPGIEDSTKAEHSPTLEHELSFINVAGGHGAQDPDEWLRFMDIFLKPGT